MPPHKYVRTDCEAKMSVYPVLPCSCHTELDAPMPIFQRATNTKFVFINLKTLTIELTRNGLSTVP